MELDLAHIWTQMGPAAKGVVIVLFVMGGWSVFAAIERLIMVVRANAASQEFAAKARPLMQDGDFEEVLKLAGQYSSSPLAQLFEKGLKAYQENIDDTVIGPVEMATRELGRKLEDVSAQLRAGTGILATTGSTAPFVGLFGTVVGIITVFTSMAADGGGGFETVSAGIAEALIVTGLGLVIAIIAVWIFNYLSQRFEAMDLQLQHASGELVDYLEAKGSNGQAGA